MLRRRDALTRLAPGALAAARIGAGAGRGAPARSPDAPRPIARPVAFDSPEADRLLADLRVFPPDNPWNRDISGWPVHPGSRAMIASIGADRPLRYNPDMAFVPVPPDQPRVAVRDTAYPGESDRGPFPIPDDLPVEGWPAYYRRSDDPRLRALGLEDVQRDRPGHGGDRHAIVVDPVRRALHEFFAMRRAGPGREAAQASTFDLGSNRLRPEGWTSADAAGLPIFPAVVRHDELQRGVVAHALRVTVRRTRRAYVYPARHFAGRAADAELPRMGERIRLRLDYDTRRFSPEVRTILEALKRHGMPVADNGIDWAISVAPDGRIPALHEEIRRVQGSAFEVVRDPGRARGGDR